MIEKLLRLANFSLTFRATLLGVYKVEKATVQIAGHHKFIIKNVIFEILKNIKLTQT